MTKLVLAAALMLALSACAHPGAGYIIVGSANVGGPSAALYTDGTAKASLMSVDAGAAIVPTLDAAGNPLRSQNACGGLDALNVNASIKNTANAGVASSSGRPGVGGDMDRGVLTGEAAKLRELARVQEVAGTSINVMREYHDCHLATAPAQADNKTSAPQPSPAPPPN
jgi:hypothetical protein